MAIALFLAALLVGSVYSQTTYSSAPAGSPPAGTPPAGAPPAGTPPAGTPPAGTPPAGTPPAGTPPAGTPPSGASCSASVIDHSSLSGEAYFKAILADMATQELAVNNAIKAGGSGTFFSILQNVNNDNLQLQAVTSSMTGAACLTLNQNLGKAIGDVQSHANDVIQGSTCAALTGDAKNQYILLQLGVALNVVQKQAQLPANVANTYPGQYLTVIQNLNTAINRVQKVITNSDTSSECVSASMQLASALNGILAAGGVTIS